MVEGWIETTVGELCDRGQATIQTGPFGSQLHSYDYEAIGVPVVPTEAIGRRRIEENGLPRVSEATAHRLARHKLRSGDILFARRGVQATGLSAPVESKHEGWLCGTGAILLRLQSSNVDPTFISFALACDATISWLKAQAVGAVMPNLNVDVLRRLPLWLPPIEQQRVIAQVLGVLDDKIELNRRMNETLEAIAQGIFESWFVNFEPVREKAAGHAPQGIDSEIAALFPDGFEQSELGEIPAGWCVRTVDEQFNLTMGQSPPGETYNETGEGLRFYQGRADFGFRYPSVRVFCTSPTRFAKAGDTLVSVRAPVGSINMATEDCCIGRGLAAVHHKSGSRSYSYYCMRSLESEFARFEAEGTVFGSISKGDFHAMSYVVPSLQLVEAFERLVFPLDQHIEDNGKESATLVTLRDTVLPKLLSGEVRVNHQEGFSGSME